MKKCICMYNSPLKNGKCTIYQIDIEWPLILQTQPSLGMISREEGRGVRKNVFFFKKKYSI